MTSDETGGREGGTMIGKGHRGVPVIVVERNSQYATNWAAFYKTAEPVPSAITGRLNPYMAWVHAITYDNAREYADHEGMANGIEICIYLASPYASLKRSLNKNANDFIMKYFPEKRYMATVTKCEIEKAVNKLNHCTKKSLGYRVPYEVFVNNRASLTVAHNC